MYTVMGKDKRCVYFTAFGKCKHGDTCEFAHELSELEGPPPLAATHADIAMLAIHVMELQATLSEVAHTLQDVSKVVKEKASAELSEAVANMTSAWEGELFDDDPVIESSDWSIVIYKPFNKLKDVKHPEQICKHCAKLLINKNKIALYSHQFNCKLKPKKEKKTPKKQKK